MKKIQNYLKKLSGGNSKNNGLLVKGVDAFGKKARRSKTGKSTFQISKANIKERFKHRLLFLCIIVSFVGLSMYGLMGNQNAAAGSVACTPDSGFANCTRITYSGADQTFTVPANVTSIKVKMWGAGGAGVDANYYPNQSGGGAGGYTTGTIAVTPGQVLTVVVGQGGILGATGGGAYGGGGAGGSNALKSGSPTNARGSSGGGMSALFLPGGKTAPNALLVSGGGGGASPGADTPRPGGNINGIAPFAGGGGGSVGNADTVNTAISGQGGTQSAGGAAPTTTTGCVVGSTAGSQFQGGPGSSVAAIGTNGSEAGGNEGGGGGGGGWFGGGGGKCQGATSSNTTLSFQNSSGGGGSSYIGGTGVSSASTTAGGNGVYGTPGQGGTAANNADTQYVSGIANGGTSSVAGGGTGGNGMVVIQYNVNTPDLTLAKSHTGSFTVGSTGTYSFTVNNIGTLATSGTITVTDTLPTGLTVNGGAAGAITEGGTNAANWTCNSDALSLQTITCTSSTAIAISGSSTFNFPVNVGVGTAVGTNSITNTASVSGGGQTNTTNDSSSDPTTVVLPTFTCSSTMFGSTGSNLYTVNTATATTTQVGSLSVSTAAIAVQPSTGNVYYYNTATPSQLYMWNATTATNTTLGSTFATNLGMLRLAFSPTGRLFASDSGGSGTVKLFEINPTTGAVISSGAITFSGSPVGSGDMVFDANGVLYYSIGSGLYTVDLTTRVGTLVSTMSVNPMTGLAFSGTGGFYGGNSGTQNFYSINPNTGTATLIGNTGGGPSDLGSCAFPAPSLTSTKTVAKVAGSGGATISPGDTLEYTITTTNSGNAPSTLTTLTDAIPTGTTYVASSTKLNGSAVADVSGVMPYVTANSINGVGMNAGVIGSDVGVNNVATVVFRVTVNSSSPPTTVSNQGTINFNNGTPVLTDDPTVGGAANPTVSTISLPDLTIVKSHTGSFTIGSTGTYSFSVGNSGVSATSGTITVTDTLPTGLTVNGGAAGGITEGGTNSADWTCNSNATSPQTITCTSSTAIAAAGSSVFNFAVNVGASTAVGTNSITNTATVSGGGETNVANDSSSDPTTVVLPTFTCSNTMFSSSSSVAAIYTINTSTGVGTQVGTLAVPSNAIAVQPSTSNVYYYNGTSPAQLYVWNATTGTNTAIGSSLTVNANGMLRLAFSPTGRLFASDAGAAPKLFEINPATGAIISSGTITFNVAPSGPSGDMMFDANGVLFYTFGDGLYTLNTTTRFATLVSNLTVSPMAGLAYGGTGVLYSESSTTNNFYSINSNTGTVTLIGGTGISAPGDLGSCAFPAPSLASIKTVAKVAGSGGATISPGDTLEYTITTTNSGNSPATLTTLTDAIPIGTTYVASSTKLNGSAVADVSGVMPYVTANSINGVGMNPGVIGSDAGVNNVATVVFRVTVNSSSPPTTVSNQGTINFNNGTAVLTDDPTVAGAANPTVTSVSLPDLTIAKSHTGNFTRGSTGTYTLTVNNIGVGSSAGTITMVDTLPTGLTVNGGAVGTVTPSGTNAANWTCNSNAATPQLITCTSSTAIAASGSSVFTLTVNVASDAPTSVTNSVAVSGGAEPTVNNGNNTATDPTTIPQSNFGSCDARMYLSQAPTNNTNTTLYNISTSANPLTFPTIAQGSTAYNAIGYNPTDNYIYGIQNVSNSGNSLIRIGADGSTINLGVISGLPVGNYIAADIGSNGVYYVKSGSTTMYAINISTLTATSITLSPAINGGQDIAWVNGMLYTDVGSNGQLYSINPTTGATATIGAPVGNSYNFGALYGSPTALYGNDNGGLGFYQIDLTNGIVTKISDSPGAQTNDGAHCVDAAITFPSDLAVTKTDGKTNYSAGSNNVYTITATNNGIFGAQNATVSDPLPSGITTASWTCATTGGGTCAASGTGAINDTTVDLPIGAVATYTLTMTVPAGFTGNLVNTATVTVGSSNTDSTLGNNTATDTDTAGLPNVGLLKSCPSPANCTTAPQLPGTDLTYNIAFTNTGGSGAQNMVLVDGIPTNTDYKLGSATTSLGTTGLTMVVEYSNDYDALNPTLATWTYTPVSAGGGASAGYDRNVKAIRWRATAGTLSNVSPNNTGNVSFVTKIR